MFSIRIGLNGLRLLASSVAFAFCFLALSASVQAAYEPAPLAERVTQDMVDRAFPSADRLGEEEGSPPSIAVYQGEEVIGYFLSTIDVVATPGYSGIPFDIIVAVGVDGLITGADILYHHEAFIERDPVRQVLLGDFLESLNGTDRETPRGELFEPDFVAGATVSARTMRFAIWDASRLVLRARSGRPVVTEPTLDLEYFIPSEIDDLVAIGALGHLTITNQEMTDRVLADYGEGVELDARIGRYPEGNYIDVYVGLATAAQVGRNVLGATRYESIFGAELPMSVLFVSKGDFSPRGFAYLNASTGYRLDRLRLVQGELEWTFVQDEFERVSGRVTSVVGARDGGVMFIPPDTGFDPLQSWSLELLALGVDASGQPFTIAMPVDAGPSEAFVLMPEPPLPPAWLEAWTDARVDLIILGIALTILTLLFIFQRQLTSHRRLYTWTRTGFLIFTLVWLGLIAGGQLSTLHLINYAMAPFKDFGWAFYLAEPLIVVLVVYVVFSLILLGRGVFCGWLCPFGAMQELLAKVAWFFRIPRWNPSDRVQSKAWMGKYIAAAGLIIVAIGWPEAEPLAAEVEPFKTAITSMFSRPLPYVGYAVLLLGIGLFTERAYCRFLCPLGGLLAVFDRLHIFTLLKRRPECGTSCQLCERSCPVKAIKPSGEIVMAECFQCLDCQVEYHDDRRCPPLAKKRKQARRKYKEPMIQPIPAYSSDAAGVQGA